MFGDWQLAVGDWIVGSSLATGAWCVAQVISAGALSCCWRNLADDCGECGEKREEVSHMESCQGVKDTTGTGSVTETLHKELPPLITQQRAALEGPAQN